MSNFSYAYAMGRVRAVERKMLSQGQFDRMIEASSPEDAFRILREAEYGGAGPESQFAARDYERLLDAENERLTAFIKEVSPEPRLLNIFLPRYDYHNIKVFLKAEFSGAAGDLPISRSGAIDPEKLAGFIRDRDLFNLPAHMAAGVQDAIQAYRQSVSAGSPDPQSIDIRLDRAMYAQMLSEASGLQCPFIEHLVRIYIDLANISAFLRMREMNKSAGFLRGALLPGGSVGHDIFIRFLQDNADGFTGAMLHTPFARLCEDGLKSFKSSGRMTALELGADNYVNAYIKKAKLLPMGLEIIAAYYIARQTELKNVRIAMVGKINGIAQGLIKERLRECYV